MINNEPNQKKINDLISLFNQKEFLNIVELSQKLLIDYPNSVLINNIAGVAQT